VDPSLSNQQFLQWEFLVEQPELDEQPLGQETPPLQELHQQDRSHPQEDLQSTLPWQEPM